MTINTRIRLSGLVTAPPQVLGGVRLVPLIRNTIREDLRLSRRAYDEDVAIVELDRRTAYVGYIPHGLVANWTDDGGAVYGSQLTKGKEASDGKTFGNFITARGMKKMARREGKRQLRFLPLHVAMEGLLSLHFGGPDMAWSEYSRQAMRSGLSPRSETVISGYQVAGLEDALRLFEIHDQQVGVLVFVADTLASAFVVSHPADYAELHATLLTDFYGELIWRYGIYATENVIHPEPIAAAAVSSLQDLRRQVEQLRQRWTELGESMAPGLLDADVDPKQVYRFKPFTLEQFITDLDPKSENHIGEMIYADDGTLQYLKSYRLSASQTRRAYLLKQLAAAEWNLDRCAESLGCRTNQLYLRLENAGFGYLLHQHVLDGAKAQERRR
ncbi:ARPP-2 domain-containing protein [Blastopirellula marina]|uniref:ARG and Rhodanese-Phosphatase-superfamily-associated domain-containing protein n=1 Tax=Blastopirellula marina TaxID=124 RepID=A0A2S8F334_9BACT|nr:hypothetical protein [Blastopirellula marina]PQO26575.1 hypothetical protein C5Y98_29770 [Blastopirellula marina]PTL40886.1 hypothetical protein C5Y97_29785 [Blastopirellula marina]